MIHRASSADRVRTSPNLVPNNAHPGPANSRGARLLQLLKAGHFACHVRRAGWLDARVASQTRREPEPHCDGCMIARLIDSWDGPGGDVILCHVLLDL